MLKFLHHLFNPHCEDCRHDHSCNSCETLRSLLAEANFEKKQLLNTILELTNPKAQFIEPPISEPEHKPIGSRFIPWEVKRRMLEDESRETARLLKTKEDEMKLANANNSTNSVSELEQQLGIKNNG